MGTASEVDSVGTATSVDVASQQRPTTGEKTQVFDEKHDEDIEVASERTHVSDYDEAAKVYVPDDAEEFIDPRLKDYPIPLVAKTVDLHNDFR